MLEQRSAPYVSPLDPQGEPFVGGLESFQDAYALGLVLQTFQKFETWRNQNHDARWRVHDMLYFGAMQQRVWDGTTTPRASLPWQITFDQIESAVPAVMQALFSGDDWFEVAAEPGAEPKEAREIASVLHYYTEHCKNEYGHTAELELENAVHSALQYGNGFIHVYWDAVMQRPSVEWVDIRDIYIDPATPGPNVQESRAVVHRRLMTVDELDQMRDDPRMRIPSRDVLVNMSMNRSFTMGDSTIKLSEAQRKISYSPGADDFIPLPADQYIEVLVYYSKTKIVWVLNREWTAYNRSNPYGFVPFCAAPCYSVLRRFYAQSVCDVLEGNQLYMQGLMNAHLDELSLGISPPRTKKVGGAMMPSTLAWRPGLLMEMDDATQMVVHEPSGITANVKDDLMLLQQMSQLRTGINAMGQGVPMPSNANRTMGGMQMQLQGASSRLYRIVAHMERYLVVPMLYMMYRLTQYHSLPTDMLPAMRDGGEVGQTNAYNFKKPVRFTMHGASKMATREKLAQVVPFITQYVVAGPVLAELPKMGKTFDFEEFADMIQDAAGTSRKYKLIREMTPQEKQASSQPDPKTMAEMQKAQMERQTRLEMGQMAAQTDMAKIQSDHEIAMTKEEEASAREILKLIADELLSGGDAGVQQAKLQLEKLLGEQKLRQKEEEHQMKMQHDRQKADNDMQVESMRMMTEAQKAQGEAEIERFRAANSIQSERAMHDEKLRQTREQGENKIAVNREMGNEKLKQAKALRVLGSGGKGRGRRKTSAR